MKLHVWYVRQAFEHLCYCVHVCEVTSVICTPGIWAFVLLCAYVCGLLAVSKAFKTLENEEGYKRCQEIVEEAKSRVDEAVSMQYIVLFIL